MTPSDTPYVASPYAVETSHFSDTSSIAAVGDRPSGMQLQTLAWTPIFRITSDVSASNAVAFSPPVDVLAEAPQAHEVVDGTTLTEAALAVEERNNLLARQYAGTQLSHEQDMRMRILRERILRLIPSATVEDYEALAGHLEEATEMRSELEAMQKEFKDL